MANVQIQVLESSWLTGFEVLWVFSLFFGARLN